jgi:hypothetical protein
LNGRSVLTFRDNLSVPSSRVKKPKKKACPETSVQNYHSTLRNTPEERRSQGNKVSSYGRCTEKYSKLGRSVHEPGLQKNRVLWRTLLLPTREALLLNLAFKTDCRKYHNSLLLNHEILPQIKLLSVHFALNATSFDAAQRESLKISLHEIRILRPAGTRRIFEDPVVMFVLV